MGEYGEGGGREEKYKSETGSESEADNKGDSSSDIEEDLDTDKKYDFDGSLDLSEADKYDFDGSLDLSEADKYDFDGSLDFSEMEKNEKDKNDNQNEESNKEDYVENFESLSTSTVLISEREEIEGEMKLQDKEEEIEIHPEELDDTELVENTDEIDFIKDVEELAKYAREIRGENESIEPQIEKEYAEYYAEQYYESLKKKEVLNEQNNKEEQEEEELMQEVAEELKGDQESGYKSDELEKEDISKSFKEITSTEEFEYLWEVRDKLDREGKTSEEIEEVMHEAEEMYKTIKNAERLYEEQQQEKLKLVDHEDEATEEDLKEVLDRTDLVEQAVELEEKLFQQGESQEEIDARVEEAIETTKFEEKLEKINELEQESIVNKKLKKRDLEINEQNSNENVENEENLEVLKPELDAMESESDEEDWKTTLKQWIKKASEEEYNAEFKSELKQALESYGEFDDLTREYLELYDKSQRKKLSEKEKNRIKSLTEKLRELDPIKLELLKSVFFIKKHIAEQYCDDFWNWPLVNRVLSKFFKHISQKWKNLKKAQENKEKSKEILRNWIEQASEGEISPELKEKLKEIVANKENLEILKLELDAIESESEDKKDLLEEITKLGSEESDEEEDEDLQELYRREMGKRPIYARQKTKGYNKWLEQRELRTEKIEISKSESEEKKEIKEEGWKTTLKQWIKEASEEECNAELKSELKKALESFNEFEDLTRKFLELYEKSQCEKLTEKENFRLKFLTERLQGLGPIQLELLANIRAFKDYFYNHLWELMNRFFVIRMRSKFFKHISQKYKELRKEQESEQEEEIMQNNVLLKQKIKAVPYNEFKLNKIKNNVSSIEIEELKERLKRLLNSKKKEILEGTFIPTPDNIAAIDKNFDLGDSWKKKAKNLYNVLRWWIQKNTRFKNLTELKEHYLGIPQVRDIAKELNKFLNLKKAEILDGKFIPTLKNIKMADKKFEQLSKITRISYIIFRWLNNNTPFKSLQDLQEYHSITPENEQIKAFLNSKKQEILKGEFLPYRENFIALDNRYAKFGRFDHIVNYWIKIETPYKNITKLKEKFCGMDIGRKIKKYLDSRKADILSGKFIPTKFNLRKINPDFANYYYSDRSVRQWLNKNSNFKSIRDLIKHFLYELSYQDLGYNSSYTLKFNEEKYRVKNAWFQVVRKIDNNRLIQIDQRKSPKTWEGLFSFLNKNNQWKFVDILTGEILEMDDRIAFHHIDGDKLNDDFFNLIFSLAANHAIITATQLNWKELSEFFEDIIISNLYSILEGQIPESWKVGWREMAVEKEFKLPKSQYIRKKEFKQKFAEIKPEFMDLSEWFDRK